MLLLAACAGDRPSGLGLTLPGSGPQVVWDLEARPLPRIPFPTDLATRADPSSPTGRRINISTEAPTEMERLVRQRAGELEGFSTFGTISVAFDAPLDLGNIITRHHDNNAIDDDVVLLVNVDPRSAHFGEHVPLDLGQGSFPLTVPELDAYWRQDPRIDVPNLLFDTTDEDRNGNGRLDAGEDSDGDGYLDQPNVYPPGGDPVDDLVTFYERVTDTLLVRPLLPLEQQTRYAVVLTDALLGENGQPVRSPWPLVHHGRDAAALASLPDALAAFGLGNDDVAFAWTFTTQGPTRDLEALRRGLYGHGPLARLAEEFPPAVELLPISEDEDRPYLMLPGPIGKAIIQVGPLLDIGAIKFTAEGARVVAESYDYIAYFVAGRITGPNLLADRDGDARPGYPADEDEVWQLDRQTGEAYYRPQQIPFMCAIPRADRGQGPPFPVALYQHGYGSTMLEQIAFAGNIARYGIATCTIDAWAHAANIGEIGAVAKLAFDALGVGPLYDAVFPSRARDLTNDGLPNVAGDLFTADLFHGRDTLRQTVLDVMVLTRALRSFDGRAGTQDLDGDGAPELAGDFNGDGIVDIGGPDAPYYTWGTSLGAIVTSVVAGIEPAVVAAAPQSGGGGLIDIALRSTQGQAVDGTILRSLSPTFAAVPTDEPGMVEIIAIVNLADDHERLTVVPSVAVAEGDRVELHNLRSGERRVTYAGKGGGFRLHVAADALNATQKRLTFGLEPAPRVDPLPLVDTTAAGDALAIEIYDGPEGALKQRIDSFGADVDFEGLRYPAGQPLVALTWGFGHPRNSPGLRQLLSLAQLAIDPADPVNYAPHYAIDPLPAEYDTATPGANVLVIAIAGDDTVPVATAVNIARAAGVVGLQEVDPRWGKTPNQVLIDNYIIEALSRLERFGPGKQIVIDPENFSRGLHAPEVPRLDPPLRLQKVGPDGGIQALRIPLLAPAGQHAFILPNPEAPFDNDTFLVHMVARFFQTGGTELPDDPCMATASCPWTPD